MTPQPPAARMERALGRSVMRKGAALPLPLLLLFVLVIGAVGVSSQENSAGAGVVDPPPGSEADHSPKTKEDGDGDGDGGAGGVDGPKVNRTAQIEEILSQVRELRESRRHDDDEAEWSARLSGLVGEAEALGSAEATAIRGEMHMLGEGVGLNLTEAVAVLQEAADRGNPTAQTQLAFMYGKGFHKGGIEHRDEALSLLHYYFAAVGGASEAQLVLGYRHLYGYGVPKSCSAAIKYYSKVAQDVVLTQAERNIAKPIELVRLSDEKARNNKLEETEDVIQYYQHSAEHGNAEAQVALGQLNFYGARGVEQNTEAAARYFQQAAAQGNAVAKSNLAQMYIQGLGVEGNNETAFKYFKEAAAQGDSAAQNGLGYMYLHGVGTKQDHQMAMKYFKMSAEQGNVDAQFNLGAMYFAGMGVDVDYGAALQYFTLAGHQGHVRSLFNLAQMHMNGLGTVQSCPIAVKLFKNVGERGQWARVLSSAHRNFLKEEYETAFVKYCRAADQGYELAQSNVAWMLEQGIGYPFEDTNVIMLEHLQRAATQGNVDANRMIGDHYYYGLTSKNNTPNFEEAARYYTIAGEQKNAHANFNLGFMHQHGIGLPFDLHLAKRFYDLALENSPEAYIPVQLALLGLHIHTVYLAVQAWWEGKLEVGDWESFSKIISGVGLPNGLASGPDDAAGGDKASSSSSSSASSSTSSSASTESSNSSPSGAEKKFTWEDVMLLIACGLLAVLIYYRSQRPL